MVGGDEVLEVVREGLFEVMVELRLGVFVSGRFVFFGI